MDPEELNILLHAVPNSRSKQAYIQGWDFGGRSYKETYEIFERMEIADEIYKGGAPSQNSQQAEYNRAIFGRNQKGWWAASSYNPKKGRAGKRKKIDSGHPSNAPTGAKKDMHVAWPRALFQRV